MSIPENAKATAKHRQAEEVAVEAGEDKAPVEQEGAEVEEAEVDEPGHPPKVPRLRPGRTKRRRHTDSAFVPGSKRVWQPGAT